MSANDVAGLLVLLGVVGVLAAIAGSGIEAGPVKFPSIPGSRQTPLAVASVVVILGGALWWAAQRQSGNQTRTPSSATQTAPIRAGKLRVVLIPANSNIRVGNPISVSSEVYDSVGQQLGGGQCDLKWNDGVSKWNATTKCNATVSEPPVSAPGIHRILAQATGRSGTLAIGKGSVEVTVRP
jgi:hypothetical protein